MPRLREPPKRNQFEAKPFDSAAVEKEEDATPFDTEEVVEVEVKPEPKPEVDPAVELKKEIEALKKAEAVQRERAERAEAERAQASEAARQRETEAEKAKNEIVQSRVETFTTGIAKETEAIAAAKRDLAVAISNGDAEAQADAYERLSEAKINLLSFKNGKAALDAEIEEAKNAPKPEPQPQQQVPQDTPSKIRALPLPETAKAWLLEHPEYLTDETKNAEISYYHQVVTKKEGLEKFTKPYYESLEKHLGLRQDAETEAEPEPQERTSIVSAPVSREVPSANGARQSGSIRLTAAQREAAKMAGITEAEYARNLVKFQKAKADGEYGERR